MAQEINPMQIARFDSKGCLMEIMDAFAIGKVKVSIAPYNIQSKKQIAINSFFLDFQDWFALSQRIQLGSMLGEAYNEKMMSEQAKATGQTYYMRDLHIQYGGTYANKLKDKDKRPSGADEARVFRIYPSSVKDGALMFSIAKGDGKREGNGAIKPLFQPYINKSDGSTIVAAMPVDYNELRGACQLVDMRIQAFITKQQFDGAFAASAQENENREGISNTPIEPQNLNTPRTENVIPDEVAFPPETNPYNNQQNMQAYPQGNTNYQQQTYQQQPVQSQPAQQNVPNGNGFFGNPQQPWSVYQ